MAARVLFPRLVDGVLTGSLAAMTVVGVLAFGGAAWWVPPVLAGSALLAATAWCARVVLDGRMTRLRSPLGLCGAALVALAVVQTAPLPGPIAELLSPRARAVYTTGGLPELVTRDDPDAATPPAATVRSPISLDRAATLRWAAGALVCLALFTLVAQHTDRLGRLYWIWGGVVAACFVNTAVILVQLTASTDGLYGLWAPGAGPAYAPSMLDAAAGATALELRPLPETRPGRAAWAAAIPASRSELGSMPGGPAAFIALATLACPLALAMMLQIASPRGSREPLAQRLRHASLGGALVLLGGGACATAALVGWLGGAVGAAPMCLGVLVAGLPSAFGTGLRWFAVLTSLAIVGTPLASACGRAAIAEANDPSWLGPRDELAETLEVWRDSARIARDFPVAGAGLGGFGAIHPYYKRRDSAWTTARGTLARLAVEAGATGLAIVGVAGLWYLAKLPRALARVGSADRALAFGLIGASLAFMLAAITQAPLDAIGVATACAAVAGTANRWLAGGTDLFVDRA